MAGILATALAVSVTSDRIPFVEPSTAQAAIEVSTVNGWYEIRIAELAEGTEQIDEELSQLGLSIGFDFIPVSPSLEGKLVASSGGDGRENFVEPNGVVGHTPAVRVPVDYASALRLTIGRPAEPGEEYISSPALGAEAPGEMLYGSHVFNMPVGQVISILEQRGLTAEWRDENNTVRPSEDLLNSYVTDTVPLAPNKVLIWTVPEPLVPDPRPPAVRKALGY